MMKADRWPLPKMEEIFDHLEGSKVFTTLDLFSCYWKVRMASMCKEKTMFVCCYGIFQFEVMLFRAMNPPWTFQWIMDYVSRDMPFDRVDLEDVAIYSAS